MDREATVGREPLRPVGRVRHRDRAHERAAAHPEVRLDHRGHAERAGVRDRAQRSLVGLAAGAAVNELDLRRIFAPRETVRHDRDRVDGHSREATQRGERPGGGVRTLDRVRHRVRHAAEETGGRGPPRRRGRRHGRGPRVSSVRECRAAPRRRPRRCGRGGPRPPPGTPRPARRPRLRPRRWARDRRGPARGPPRPWDARPPARGRTRTTRRPSPTTVRARALPRRRAGSADPGAAAPGSPAAAAARTGETRSGSEGAETSISTRPVPDAHVTSAGRDEPV